MRGINNTVSQPSFQFPLTEAMLLLVAIFWGTSYGLTKEVLIYSSVLLFIAIRFSITFFCLLPVVIRDFRRGLNKDWRVAIPTGIILASIYLCEVHGISQTSASKAAFLISLSVILTAFIEPLVNRTVISGSLFLLAILSISGVYLLTLSADFEFSINSGDYLILCAAFLRALMVTTTKRLMIGKDISTATLTAIQSLIVSASALVLCLIVQPLSEITLPSSPKFWLTMVYLVIFCTLFALFIQNYAVQKISPSKVSLLMGSEPLFGALFAIVWLNESFTMLQALGASMILLSVVAASINPHKQRGTA